MAGTSYFALALIRPLARPWLTLSLAGVLTVSACGEASRHESESSALRSDAEGGTPQSDGGLGGLAGGGGGTGGASMTDLSMGGALSSGATPNGRVSGTGPTPSVTRPNGTSTGGGSTGGTSMAGGSAGGGSTGAGSLERARFTGATGSPCESDADCYGGMTCLSEGRSVVA